MPISVCFKHKCARKLLNVSPDIWRVRRAWVCPECLWERLQKEHEKWYGRKDGVEGLDISWESD